MAFHILKSSADEALALARALTDVKQSVGHCSRCYNLTDHDPCPICADPRRDHGLILVVEQPKDLIALEQTAQFRGVYHVLMGRLSPLDGIGPDSLTIDALLDRLPPEGPPAPAGDCPTTAREVILGLNPTVEGDGTALYVAELLRSRPVRITRLARGLPAGGNLEYASKAVLGDAIQGRQAVEAAGSCEQRPPT